MRFVRPSKGLSIGLKWGLYSFALAGLAGCSTLPSSGPTGSQIAKIGQDPDGTPAFNIVEVSGIANLPPPVALPILPAAKAHQPTDIIGSGDFLDIAIYEAGVSLFSGNGGSSLRAVMDPSTQVEKLPVTRVDDNGYIRVPFAGQIRASGLTTAQLAANIHRALQGMSQNPQVIVALRESIANSVLVSGEVGKPGRLALSTNRETLSDAIALAGGYKGDSKDYAVRVQRGTETSEMRLSDALSDATRDFPILPGDKIAVIRQPQSFSVMGAPGRVEQIPFTTPQVTLAEALAQSGGANPNMGDPKAVFVFRFIRDEQGRDIPTVYHLNMMDAKSYFLAQRFGMRDKDILYIGNARANQPSKLVQIIGQLFTPIAIANTITGK